MKLLFLYFSNKNDEFFEGVISHPLFFLQKISYLNTFTRQAA